MTTISQPSVTINLVPAQTEVSNKPQKVLFVGQKVAAGTATAGQLITDIQNDNSWDTLFGANSMLAGMIRAARRENGVTRFDAIALDDDGGGTKSAGEIAFGGTLTDTGSLQISIVSEKDYTFTIDAISGDTPTSLGTKLETAIAANANIPVTAVNTTGTVALTADNAGTEANSFTIKITGNIPGITATITAFTGGTTDPSTTGVFDVVGNLRYQTIVSPFAYGTSYLTSFLDPRFNVTNNVLDGVGIVTSVDSLANLEALANALNSQSLVIFGDNATNEAGQKGGTFVEAPYVMSSMVGAIRALRLTEDAEISQYVIGAGGALDTFGGPALASLPYFNTPLPNMVVTDSSLGFTEVQIDSLNAAGVSVVGNNVSDNEVIMGEVVTTYKNDNAGNPDVSFKYLNYVDTSSNAREYMFNNAKSDFAQSRLTEGDLIPFRNINNADSIKARFVGYYTRLSEQDYVLTQAGEAALQYYKQNLSVTIDLADGKATVLQQVPIVTQLRTIISTFQLVFDF
jgi:phage tail sheath gpL-like